MKKHTKKIPKPPGYWTENRIRQEANRYKVKSDFNRNCTSGFQAAKRLGILDKVCEHMMSRETAISLRKTKWNKESLKKEAQKYKTKSEFRKKNSSAYSQANRMNIMPEISRHMPVVGNKYLRAIYAFEFSDKSVYVGLTHDYEERHNNHLLKGPVHEKLKTHKAVFRKFNKWYRNAAAQKAEASAIELYSKKGWQVLNVARAGGLGGGEKRWTSVAIMEEVKKYDCLENFRLESPGAYSSASALRLLPKIRKLLPSERFQKGYWSKNRIKHEAKKFNSRSQFMRSSPVAYRKARKNGFLEEICRHMPSKSESLSMANRKWTLKKCSLLAKRCKTRIEFRKRYPAAYSATVKYGWAKKVMAKLLYVRKKKKFHTFDSCQSAAKKCKKISTFKKRYPSQYRAALENKWLEKISGHMKRLKVPNGYWRNIERLKLEALKYSSRTDFKKGSKGAYVAAHELSIIDQISSHMKKK